MVWRSRLKVSRTMLPYSYKFRVFFFRPIQPRTSGEGGTEKGGGLLVCFPGEGKKRALFGPCSRALRFSEFFSVPASGGRDRKGLLASLGREEGWVGWLVGCFLCCGWVGSGWNVSGEGEVPEGTNRLNKRLNLSRS